MNGKSKNAFQRWLRSIEVVLLACGLALLAFWGTARVQSIVASRKAIRELKTLDSAGHMPADRMQAEAEGTSSGAGDFGLWDESSLPGDNSGSAEGPDATLAVLRIPKIGVEVPVLEGTDNLTLNYAVGRIPGTARPGQRGNIGIAGHRDTFFRGLKDVSVGDSLQLESSGETAVYIVDRIRIVNPEDVGVLEPRSLPTLTLVTCYPFHFVGNAPKRYIVSATLAPEARRAVKAAVPVNNFVLINKEEQ